MKIYTCPVAAILLACLVGCDKAPPDEAKAAGQSPLDFPAASHDFFADMDMIADDAGKLKRLELSTDEIKGRNTWVMWCGGNEAFWDWLGGHSYGFLDLLKLVASPDRETALSKRKTRFGEAGTINEPGCAPAKEKDEFGLIVEVPTDAAPQPKEAIYGRSSGVVGLRLFKNPKFNASAKRRWDAKRYFEDSKYYNDPDLVRPYRVGMSCGFCHVAPHPLNPPKDVAEPNWANLSSNIGNQYWRASAIFGNLLKKDNFVYHLLASSPPGTIDTSLVSSDNINNPNTINAVYEVPGRLDRSGITQHRSKDWLDANQRWFNEFNIKKGSANLPEEQADPARALPILVEYPPDTKKMRPVPRVLLDGSDSVGAWIALARVYINIGTYHQQWIRLHNTIIGVTKQKAFKIEDCEENSVYWQANKPRVEYLAKFFLKSTAPMRLKDAPGGTKYLNVAGGEPWHEDLRPGRKVFARRCVVCHSSKQPDLFQEFAEEEAGMSSLKGRGRRWSDLLALQDDPEYQNWAQKAVQDPDFFKDNALTTDHRVPVTLLQTNSSRAMATNALTGHMWEDFASETYKHLPSVGKIGYFDPFDPNHSDKTYDAPGNGRGYYRPATLVSIWATAPYLHNNSVGIFNNDPSVEGRMKAFDDGIKKLLVRAGVDNKDAKLTRADLMKLAAANRRKMGSDLNGATLERIDKDRGVIWRTPAETKIRIPATALPSAITNITAFELPILNRFPWLLPVAALFLALILLLAADCECVLKYVAYAAALVLMIGVLVGIYSVIKRVVFQFVPLNLTMLQFGLAAALAVLVVIFGAAWKTGKEKRLVRCIAYLFVALALLVAFASYFFTGRLGDLELGPIPKDTPVNLLGNLGADPKTDVGPDEARLAPLLKMMPHLLNDMRELRQEKREEKRQEIMQRMGARLMEVNRCPDFVMDRGHYFAAELTQQELDDLIDLIKTF